ncbi:acyl-CoA thioesterase [Rhizosphaericola mali]|uniref:Acyl-CoA thioesterase n=1 Tax=Rhizosphaericola mali TaxID=2545455 RepID=A0A5P2GAW4_9BACT|nr:hotdog domain-containing protein [Rhizosphaericola mali]QES90830.1 acyl-CoA thioesterase [Rhizosphaericola mali]
MVENQEERINASETHSFKTIFTSQTNHHNTLFGGAALAIMDDVAFVTATRFCRQRFVTVSTDKVSFEKPIPNSSIIEAIGRVDHVGNSSISIKVVIFVEEMYSTKREKAIEGIFKMVAVDENGHSTKIV